MSANLNYTHGLGHVGSYQASARPYIASGLVVPTSSAAALEVSFESVTRFITIKNTSAIPIKFGFSALGIAGVNYIELAASESYSGDWKVSAVFLLSTAAAGTATIAAGLTGISSNRLPSNWSGSAGVG